MSSLIENQIFAHRYLLIKRLGSGAFSEVWKAEDTKADNLVVAIKIYAPDKGMDEDGIAIFSQEFALVFNTTHQNLLRPNHFEVCDGSPYLVLPFCEKGSVSKFIGKMGEREVVVLLHDVSSGLSFLHEQNPPIIHQDIKPDNVLITEDDHYKLTDFGISTRIRSTLRKNVDQKNSGGTMAYMAPERFDRNPDPIKASDVWSLGATAYELMTGDAPFGNLGGVALKNGADIPEITGDYSEDLKNIVEKCLSREPWDRPMAAQIEEKTALYLKTGSWNAPVASNVLSSKKRIITVAVAAFLLLLGSGLWIWDYNRVKVHYYKDYVEQWGVPQGIGKLSKKKMAHRSTSYRLEYQKRKLIRLSYVNSVGKITKHMDSEHVERPSDMLLYYTDNGDVDYVKHLDQYGKVLFKKDYNDKLNVVTFQYDDEYDTEFSLSMSTLKIFTNPFDDDSESKGRISRYLLTYNEKGYVTKIQYAGFQNMLVGDKDGIYGRSYVLDNKGRVVEEHYFGIDGKPKSTRKGLGIRKHKFLDNDDWVETAYYTIDEQPSADESGVPVVKIEYDKYGNRIRETYVDEKGSLVIRSDTKSAGFCYEYNDKGQEIYRYNIDVDENQCFGDDGVSGVKQEYDKNGYCAKISFTDVEGVLCNNNSGYAYVELINDDKGNVLEAWIFDMDGNITEIPAGYAGYKAEYDSIGNQTLYVTYGKDKEPCLTDDLTAGYRAEYNAFNYISTLIYIDVNLQPCENANGVAYFVRDYDKRGNVVKGSFYDKEYRLTLSNDNVAGWKSTYDDNGNEISRSFFDAQEKPTTTRLYAKWEAKYDEKNNRTEVMYYDLNNKLVNSTDGYAGVKYKFDERGNVIEEFKMDRNGGLAFNKLLLRYKYDKNDNVTEYAVFDKENKPALNSLNYHKYICKYNNRNQVIEKKYYGKDGNLILNNDRYAVEKFEYNSRGETVKKAYFNTNQSPCCCLEGWSSNLSEYDVMGRITRQLFFDENGDPTRPDKMVPEGVCKYDKWGNMVYVAAMDGHGKIIDSPVNGYAVTRKEYDIRGNLLMQSYYDKDDNLTICKGETYAKIVHKYDRRNNQIETQYYGKDGCLRTNEFAIRKVTFDTQNRESEYRFYDANNKPCEWFSGIHRVTFEYDENSRLKYQKCYKTNGTYFATYNAKTNKWENVVNESNTQQKSQTSNASWKEQFRGLDLPEKLEDEVYATKVSVGSNNCTLTIQLREETKYDFSESKLTKYKDYGKRLATNIKKNAEMPNNATLYLKFIDKAGRDLFTVSQ